MKILIKKATVTDPTAEYHGEIVDILIENGVISAIDVNIEPPLDTKIIEIDGLHVSCGWADLGTYTGDPGFEHKEDLESVCAAAAKGGFTALFPSPNTAPTVHSKTEVQYVLSKTARGLVEVLPLGAVTLGCEGKQLAELYEMYAAGAVGFSDGYHAVQHNGVMKLALLYAKSFDGLVIHQPTDAQLSEKGYMHEGVVSTSLGVPGIPALAEELMVQRDLYLVEYTDGRLHLANLSTQGAVGLVRQAKGKGLKVTASVNPLNLTMTDESLLHFDENLKVAPPIRSLADLEALWEGLGDGTIDCIQTNHRPQDTEGKDCEFVYAQDGAVMLETAFAILNTHHQSHLSLAGFIEKIAHAPRRILGLPPVRLAVGERANLTLFDPLWMWTVKTHHFESKSRNTPFIGKLVRGAILGIVNNDQLILFKRP